MPLDTCLKSIILDLIILKTLLHQFRFRLYVYTLETALQSNRAIIDTLARADDFETIARF